MTEEQKSAWEADLATGKGEIVDAVVAFQTYACSYIKYMQIFQKLEACYAQYGCDINIVTDHYAKVAGVEKKSQDEK